jgi:hypothetical protein
MNPTAPAATALDYFVDEAGDPTLFGARGRVLLGTEGCSRYFILGVLKVPHVAALSADLHNLRATLLADPYFRRVPSMQPEQRKTALAFHAKDDVAEVRREVFQVLTRHNLRFFAVVRDKQAVLSYVQRRNAFDDAYRFNPNELYDSLVSRLFKDRLHLSPEVRVCFARRGSADRSSALSAALAKARHRFAVQWGKPIDGSLTVRESIPAHDAPLQATDYFLWALQRHFERQESRFLELLWPQVGLVHAVDDTRRAAYGEYYTRRKPLV